MKRFFTVFTTLVFFIATTPFALATDYNVELVVPDGKKSKQTDAVLRINQNDFQFVIEKSKFKEHEKQLNFADLKVADYSYSKKPMLSAGGAVATALLVGFIFALPFLFIKKKNHWLTVQTEKEFAVIKLDGSNYKAVIAEFETHGVKVKEVKEEEDKKK
jgi:biopolymer transport protein ExbD